MGAHNKRHSRRLKGVCPVCGCKVVVANHGRKWWVACETDTKALKSLHIEQEYYSTANECIEKWNERSEDGET